MKIIQSSDYRIYFDDVRMDPYVKQWSATCGLRASDAQASITMHRTKKLETWKGYLTQVRIFARNIFSGKYSIIFEGELMNRNWDDQRNDTGTITLNCKGFYHWLDIPIPMMIGNEESFNKIQQFQYEAQNIDVDAVAELFKTKHDLLFKEDSIREIINKLFEQMNAGYYLSEDSSFHWANLKDRFKVMGEIIKEFRDAGYLDIFTFTRTTQIDSFYVYLTQVLTQLMFEFYQDRDGAFRIKNPSWKDQILKAHVFDEAVVQTAGGFNDWENEPTRVLVIGGQSDIARSGGVDAQYDNNVLNIPMGLYIGLPGEGEYFSQVVRMMREEFGIDGPGFMGGSGNFFDDITGNYPISDKYGVPRGDSTHRGTDYVMRYAPLKSLGVSGVVRLAQKGNETAGNWVIIKQQIDNKQYEFVYMHLSEIDVKEGDSVTGGQQIGVTGTTGLSTGPHLHLEIWEGERINGKALDPEKFLDKMKLQGAISGGAVAEGSGNEAMYMNQDLKNQSKMSADQINTWINGKVGNKKSVMANMGEAFYKASQQSGLDPVYLVSHAAHETGWGTSSIARSKYNFYGISAFDSNPYNSATTWSNASEGIIKGAVWIKKNFYDAGQNTLYKMRYSANGKHNYATDKQWPNKIAAIMGGSKSSPGASGAGAVLSGSSSFRPNNLYSGTPYASTGGFSISTSYGAFARTPSKSIAEGLKDFTDANKGTETNTKKSVAMEYDSFSTSTLKYPIPWTATSYKTFISNRPNKVNANMICCIIEIMSNWKEKNKNGDHYGLMGVHDRYIQNVLGGDYNQMYTPDLNIQHGTLLFKEGFERFSSKATFALAGMFVGNLKTVEDWIKKAGKEDFSKVRTVIPKDQKDVITFVDGVLDKFCALFSADYIKGDPHRTFVVDDGKGAKIETGLAEDTDVKDYESSYKPIMSDEERLYKVNLKVSEQLLIRYDNASEEGKPMNADELVERYAKYMMQLYRAESHGVNVVMSTCLPFVRPGFNAWLEPTRRNLVFYITRVSHQGSFGNGCFSTVSGAYVRNPKSYDDIEETIFVGATNAKASDFGEVVKKSKMDDLKKELKELHKGDEIVNDARKTPVLSKMYSSATGKESEYTTTWNQEFTSKDLDAKIKKMYEKAPDIVKDRKKKLKDLVTEAEDFFKKMLVKTDY